MHTLGSKACAHHNDFADDNGTYPCDRNLSFIQTTVFGVSLPPNTARLVSHLPDMPASASFPCTIGRGRPDDRSGSSEGDHELRVRNAKALSAPPNRTGRMLFTITHASAVGGGGEFDPVPSLTLQV